MFNKKLLVILLLFLSVCLSAEEGYIEYLDGYLDVMSDDEWFEIYMGDSLYSDSVIKLWEDSYVEIKVGSKSVKISQEGIYSVAELLKSAEKIKRAGLVKKTTNLISRMLYGDNSLVQDTVGGVRAFNIEKALQTFPDTGGEVLREAFKAFTEGKNEEARELFLESLDFPEDEGQLMMGLYFLAQISYEKDETEQALKYLNEIYIDEYSPEYDYYNLVVFLKGQILIETNGNGQALTWLEENLISEDDPITQALLFLKGLANYNIGKIEVSRKFLTRCIKINPENDISEAAGLFLVN